MNIFSKMLVSASLLTVATSCGSAQQAKLKVVTTLNYLKYVAEQVGGTHVSVTALSNPKQDPHYVTPTPRMNEIAYNADLFIENGLSLDLWAKNVIDASGNPGIQPGNQGHLVATINVPIKELPTEVSRMWGDIHPQGNPHVWLDPLNIRIIAQNIEGRLELLDYANRGYYQQRLREFEDRIDAQMYGPDVLAAVGRRAGDILARKAKNGELEQWLASKDLLSKLGGWMGLSQRIKGTRIVTYHKTYVYFTERFGLSMASELEEKPGIPPPAQRRDAIVEQVRSQGIKVILNDNFYSREASDYVAGKTGARVLVTYLDVGATAEVSTYERLISFLIERISAAVSVQ